MNELRRKEATIEIDQGRTRFMATVKDARTGETLAFKFAGSEYAVYEQARRWCKDCFYHIVDAA